MNHCICKERIILQTNREANTHTTPELAETRFSVTRAVLIGQVA